MTTTQNVLDHHLQCFASADLDGTMADYAADRECAFIFWNAESADNHYEGASDTFVIRDGKIVYQTFAAKVTPKS